MSVRAPLSHKHQNINSDKTAELSILILGTQKTNIFKLNPLDMITVCWAIQI